jgi:murein DD-endopeptidase MepM/ murein hydrolase activator NlpD
VPFPVPILFALLMLGVVAPATAEQPLAQRPTKASAPATHAAKPDPRWVFYTKDKHHYASPWFAGKHRKMVPYGCTSAPYYDPDPRCADNKGFHHGLDIAMPCGTKLYAGRHGRVVSHAALGPAYGVNPLLFRNKGLGVDFLLAHTKTVYVQPGDRVAKGQLIAKASDSGAPDGCHLHFEVRTAGGGLDAAQNPLKLLQLSR